MFGLSAVDIVVGQQYTFIIESLTVLYMRESFICDLQGFVNRFYLPGGINSLVKEGGAKLRLNMKSEVEDIVGLRRLNIVALKVTPTLRKEVFALALPVFIPVSAFGQLYVPLATYFEARREPLSLTRVQGRVRCD